MRTPVLLMLASLALSISGCNPGPTPSVGNEPATSTQQQPPDNAITGKVSLRKGVAMSVSPHARLELSLVDESRQPSVPVASKTIQPVGQLPVEYRLEFNPDRIVPDDVLVMHARIVDGDRHFSMPLQHRVLTRNASRMANIVLVPEPTPGEQVMNGYNTLKASLGGMKMSQGTSLGKDGSRAWQIFRKSGNVQFVIDIADDFKSNARVQSNFAYRDGKPFVVVQQHKPSATAKTDSIQRAGWDKSGKLVLHEQVSAGKTSKLSEGDARNLYQQAEAVYRKFADK